MDKRKYKSAVVVPKIHKLWKKMPYKKANIIKNFVSQTNSKKFISDYEELKNIPIRKRTVLAPKGIEREELVSFVGYMYRLLKLNNGNIEKVYKELEKLWQ